MDGTNFIVGNRPGRREPAQRASRQGAMRPFAILLAIALATFAGIVALEACGIVPTGLEAGMIE